jgi:hypothetical protein
MSSAVIEPCNWFLKWLSIVSPVSGKVPDRRKCRRFPKTESQRSSGPKPSIWRGCLQGPADAAEKLRRAGGLIIRPATKERDSKARLGKLVMWRRPADGTGNPSDDRPGAARR